MSESCSQIQGCGDFISLEILFKSLFVRKVSDTSCLYLSIDFVEIDEEDCDSYETALQCGDELSLEELVKGAITPNECGFPTLKIIGFRRS